MRNTFLELCCKGLENPDNVDDYVKVWHNKDTDLELYEYLGFTEKEYCKWLIDDSYIFKIIIARRNNK